ncbi:cytochrome P450 [Gigaspora margarita]|uniref:Cytochrome P450 n=1 Tax=Gigaspora margarita TaxID=4874 RepID=A0A8H4AV69_GIGMA|nr:cytochrome P450 [Gigaspora margarita]
MDLITFLAIVVILLIIYNYVKDKVPDSLKDIHSISFFSMAISQLMKRGGNDKLYLRCKEYFEKDGVIKVKFIPLFSRKWVCVITDPVFAKEMFLQTDVFPKLIFNEIVPNSAAERLFSVNVVHSNGDAWKRYRRICNPAFKTLPVHLFVEKALKLMHILQKVDNKPIEFIKAYKFKYRRFTLDILGKLPLILILIKTQILSRWNSNGDLLELMIKACEDPDNQKLSDTELRCNLAILMVAGHDTSAVALSTLLYLLAVNKNVQEKAREEVLRVLGDDLIPSSEQHASLKYLNMIIRENLRLYPSVGGLPLRVVTEDIKLKNFLIPTGTTISLFVYGIHHSSKLWKNPEEFLPERFENEHDNYSWLAFGGGSRIYLGNNFSLIEQRIVLCLLLRKYEISLPQNSIHKNQLEFKSEIYPFPIDLIFKRRNE